MTPRERVWYAVRGLRSEYVNPDRLTVHMHPEMVMEALQDDARFSFVGARYGGPEDILSGVYGLPVVADRTLPEDGIVLRYEVPA